MIDPFNIETSTYAGNVIYKAQLHIFNTAYIETYYPDIAITDLRIAESSFTGMALMAATMTTKMTCVTFTRTLAFPDRTHLRP